MRSSGRLTFRHCMMLRLREVTLLHQLIEFGEAEWAEV